MAEQVALRLIAAGELLDDEPEVALAHTLIARRLASRIAAVREAVGLAAYRAGQWQTTIGELRAYHRMSGRQSHLAVLADCERALGRPERAIDMYRSADGELMSRAEAIELAIVAAGARADLGQRDAAVAMLQLPELTSDEPWVARLRYAYAAALLAAGRREEAREWFARAAEVDEDAATDAAERLLELDGVVLDDADLSDEFGDLGDELGEDAGEPDEDAGEPDEDAGEPDEDAGELDEDAGELADVADEVEDGFDDGDESDDALDGAAAGMGGPDPAASGPGLAAVDAAGADPYHDEYLDEADAESADDEGDDDSAEDGAVGGLGPGDDRPPVP